MQEQFLWPESSISRALTSAPRMVPVAAVECALRELFPTGHPVLCSSARAALSMALVSSEMSRGDYVGVFPYASHCVLDAISRIATPLGGPGARKAKLRVVNHQWSFVQETKLPLNTIEDCVDTLCVPETKLFPGGGRFEIWSLPKILGTSSGGVLWCRDRETAEKLKKLRHERGGGYLQWILRLIGTKHKGSYYYWNGTESHLGDVSCLQTGEILKAVRDWKNFVNDRQRKLELVWPLAVKWLTKPTNRLPPVVPVDINVHDSTLRDWGLVSGFRMFEKFKEKNRRMLIKVLPVPIHQQVSASQIIEIRNKIRRKLLQ